MTRLFTEGLEMGDLLNFDSGANAVISTTQKRTGTYSARIGAGAQYTRRTITASSEIYIRIGFYGSWATRDFFQLIWRKGATVLGKLVIGQTTADAASRGTRLYVGATLVATELGEYSSSDWHLIEIHVKIAEAADGGIIEATINGAGLITYSGDTKPGADTTIDIVSFENSYSGYGGYFYIDDIAINNTAGAVDNSWCGDGHVLQLIPNGAGDSTQWTPTGGANYTNVDETPSNGDTDVVDSVSVGDKDLYNVAACGLTNGVHSIQRVWGEARGKDSLSPSNICIVEKTNGSEYDSADLVLSTAYASQKEAERLVNPQTGLPWTIAEVDALQVGIKATS